MGRKFRELLCEFPYALSSSCAQRKWLWGDDIFVCLCTARFREAGIIVHFRDERLQDHISFASGYSIDCMEVKAQTQKKLRWIQARRVGSHSILVFITSLERFSIHKCHYPPILPPWWLECCRSHICRWWQSQRYCWGRSRSLLN